MRKTACFMLILVFGLWLGVAPAATARKTHDLEILGSAGLVHQVAVGIADVLTKHHPWIRASATGTTNTSANIMAMLKKDPNRAIYMVSAASYLVARAAVAEFKGKAPVLQQRYIAGFMMGHNGFVTLDPKIKNMRDLSGKTIALVPDVILREHVRLAFEILGIHVTIKPMGFVDQYYALRDGLVAACGFHATGSPDKPLIPVPPLKELIVQKRGRVYGISFPAKLQKEAAKKLGKPWPYVPSKVLPGTLPSQNKPFEVASATTIGLAAFAGADEDLIYEITKTIVQEHARFKDYTPALTGLTPQDMLGLLHMIKSEAEIHPGALKCYKEAGLWPGAWKKAGQ